MIYLNDDAQDMLCGKRQERITEVIRAFWEWFVTLDPLDDQDRDYHIELFRQLIETLIQAGYKELE
ncbi:MAG: hypothetical protein ACYC3I_22675 [Gemmataceae bacterium]